MYARIRQYVTNTEATDTLAATLPGVADAIAALPGFLSYHVVRGTGGTLASISLFDTAENAAASDAVAAKWVSEHMAELFAGPPSMMAGEVLISRVA